MDFFLMILLMYLMLFKWTIYCQDESSHLSSVSIETQYLKFDMSQYGPDGGAFSSPNFPNYYPQDTILFYQFIAAPDYRVQIEIDFFQIRGVTPQCTHDYLDVFLNVTNLDQIHHTVNDQLLHRYCGRNKPPLLISVTNILVLGFFTEDTQTERGFNGSFRFIPDQAYRNHLIRAPCDYVFDSSISKRGEFFSSTYPGTYLPWQFCNYSFIGRPNERIHIRFRDLMLFKTPNTQHCAVDLIKLYDKNLNPPELQRFLSSFRQINLIDHDTLSSPSDSNHITDLCGVYPMPLDVFSTSNNLLFYFISTHYAELTDDEQNEMNDISGIFWRRGFYAEYEFSSSLTKLDFISQTKTHEYVSGTECDQTIKSFGQGSGKLQSPNWPYLYKPQTSCTTYLLGLDDRYTLENVEIEFEQFDIDCQLASLVIYNASRIYDYHLRSRSSSLVNTQKSVLFSNYYQQDLDFKHNLTFCGHFKPEGRFVSKNALLKIVFLPNDYSSEKTLPSLSRGGKFQAKYKFVKSYHQVSADEYDSINPNICNLSYHQTRSTSGKFEPPRSSENDYFSNSNCTFNFYPINDTARLLIWFDYFNIADENYVQCLSDNLTYTYRSSPSSIYSIYPYIYCGYRNFPPPFLTSRTTKEFRVHFRSNDDLETGLGFDGRYLFLNRTNRLFSSQCPNPFDSIVFLNETEHPTGNLSSNGYPENLVCEWSYKTSEGFQFHLRLNLLEMEGSKTKDPPQGCQSSVLKIYSEGKIEELCGTQETISYTLTNSNWFTVQFISLNRQTKEILRGFHLTWTIVQLKYNKTHCSASNDYFDCTKSSTNSTLPTGFCIHKSLICDGFTHCEPLSNNDERESNCLDKSSTKSRSKFVGFIRQRYILVSIIFILLLIILSISLILIFLIIKTKRQQQQQQHRQMDILPKEKKRIKSTTNMCLNDDDDDDDDDHQDLMGTSMMEQTVTTV